jgi:O-methyltransferase
MIIGAASPRTAPPAPTRPKPIQPWHEDPVFVALFRSIADRTLVDPVRCYMLYQLLDQARCLPGDVAEVGVYRGGTARLLAERLQDTDKHLFLFDTFAGMPSTDQTRDLHHQGDFADTSLESVRDFVGVRPNVSFHPGRFPESGAPIITRRFSFVHVDADIHQSVLDCCTLFFPRLVRGGVMVFDDYGFVSCPGAKAAVDAWFTYQLERPIYLPTGQCLVIKV